MTDNIHISQGHQNKEIVIRFWNEVWNDPYSMATFDDLVSDDFVISTDDKEIKGKEAFRDWLLTFQSKIDQLRTSPLDVLIAGEGDRIVTRMRVSGLNRGIMGTVADHAPFEFIAISIMLVENQKRVYNWVERSAFELYKRLTTTN